MATTAKPMTKSQIMSHFAQKFEMSKKNVVELFDELTSLATTETKKAGSFTLPGMGKFSKTNRKARIGRNPATGESINIPAKTVVKFKLAKAFQEQVVPPKKK